MTVDIASLPVMGTEVTVTVVDGPKQLVETCLALAKDLEHLWTRFSDSSEISRLNAGESLRIDQSTQLLIERMAEGFQLTRGAFDPAVLREVIQLGYSSSNDETLSALPADSNRPPSVSDIAARDGEYRFPPGLTLDPGGIGKGLAADLVIECARQGGADGVMANFGGDIACWGTPPDGKAWRINVEDPFDTDKSLDRVRLTAGAVATSSQLKRRFVSLRGENSHLVNPYLRSPLESDIQTVTVIAGAGWLAEVCTKPGFMWPLREFFEWVPTVNAAALVVDSDHRVHRSANWKDFS